MKRGGVHAGLCAGLIALGVGLTPAVRAAEKDSYNVTGYVVKSGTEPGSRLVVKLVESESGKVLDMTTSGMFGKFKFEDVKPGLYLLQVGEVKRELLVKSKNVRADVDLSARDGVYRSLTAEKLADVIGGAADRTGTPPGTSAGPASAANDPSLQQTLAGQYWGYAGSTERKLTLCEGGTFLENSESGYSGRVSDDLGNQTGAWGTASQRGGSGTWSVQGNARQGVILLSYSGGKSVRVPYRSVDRGCYSFDGHTLCHTGAANCR